MKKWKSLLLVCMLIFAIGMVTACGRSNNSGNQTENGTENTGTNTEAPVDETPDMNGAVEEQMQEDTIPDNGGTGSGMGATSGPEDTGLIEDTGDALQRGVDDMTDGVKDMLDPNDDSQNNP